MLEVPWDVLGPLLGVLLGGAIVFAGQYYSTRAAAREAEASRKQERALRRFDIEYPWLREVLGRVGELVHLAETNSETDEGRGRLAELAAETEKKVGLLRRYPNLMRSYANIIGVVLIIASSEGDERASALRRLRLNYTAFRDAADELAENGFDPYA